MECKEGERNIEGQCIKLSFPFKLKTVETHEALKNAFRSWQKDHPNFVTPHILKLTQKGDTIIELSEGRGFTGEGVCGVSAFSWDEDKGTFKNVPDKPEIDLYSSFDIAREKARELKEGL